MESGKIEQLTLEIRNLAHYGWKDRANAEYLFREIGKKAQEIAALAHAPTPAPPRDRDCDCPCDVCAVGTGKHCCNPPCDQLDEATSPPPEVGGWISVETRCPAPNSAVLFWTTDGTWESGYFRADENEPIRWECERTDGMDDRIDYFEGMVTHWMLPTPPSSKEGQECNCGADRTGPSAEAHSDTCPQSKVD